MFTSNIKILFRIENSIKPPAKGLYSYAKTIYTVSLLKVATEKAMFYADSGFWFCRCLVTRTAVIRGADDGLPLLGTYQDERNAGRAS